MSALDDLLAVQALDLSADQLSHRRANLPERAELNSCQADLLALETRSAGVEALRNEVARNEKRLEDEISMVRDKSAHTEKTLYSGSINVPRELTALQEEIEALARRQRQLEDQELELMEQAEPLDADLASMAAERTKLDDHAIGLLARIAEEETVIDAELGNVQARRATAVQAVPADLLDEYERLRRALGGIGIARLSGNRCEGCHLTLSAVDVDRIRHEPPDTLVHCTECSRMLVP
ncbi:MAG TPA: C4-type zinc ribbon domain-containing protein [Acidimicrobiales bacterium]|nr:C4-type zinc ribbon domain-containing protein [Acidimicrobiales bacterium]